MELQKICTMCSNVTTILCRTCKCTAYCSPACLKADLPVHQILCGELQKFMAPPSASARRGIFFPVDQKAPQFVWATTQWRPPEDGDPGYEKLNLKPYLGDQISDKIRIYGNYIRSRPRHDQIMVFMRDTCCVDGSKVNSSITALTEGNAFHSWRGGMLAMKVPSLGIDPGRYVNMDMVDFRDVVDLFRSYRSGIQMSDASCNRHHKGPASPLDDMLKTRFKQAGKSNSKKTASSGTASSSSSFGKVGVNINIEQDTTSRDDLLDNLSLGERNKNETLNETRGPALPHEYGFKTWFLQPGKSKSKKTASGTASSSILLWQSGRQYRNRACYYTCEAEQSKPGWEEPNRKSKRDRNTRCPSRAGASRCAFVALAHVGWLSSNYKYFLLISLKFCPYI